jgi:hypothetical protein
MLVSEAVVKEVVYVREQLLRTIKSEEKYVSGKYKKNIDIKYGPDFNGSDFSGKYRPAIQRYIGSLYTESPGLPNLIARRLREPDAPHMLILSALYGPLYPLDMIQDYNLKMDDPPARKTWERVFPLFLKGYIKNNAIKRVELFFGHSTKYKRVAELSVMPLLKNGLLSESVHYEVENGSTQGTPRAHGRLLANRLDNSLETGLVVMPQLPLVDNWARVIIRDK